MPSAVGISELSLLNDMLHLDIISNNLANANVNGFKRDMAVTRSFDAVLADAIHGPETAMSGLRQSDAAPQVHRITDASSGALKYTGNPLDIAIEGDAYLELTNGGNVRYSRQGTFKIDAAARLVHSTGFAVSGEGGEILLQGGEVTIDREGNISENGETVGQLKLVRFKASDALTKIGRGMWTAPAGVMGEPVEGINVRQGYVESSNVDPMQEMVRMMSVMRHFETTSNVIKGYDEMMNTAISTIADF